MLVVYVFLRYLPHKLKMKKIYLCLFKSICIMIFLYWITIQKSVILLQFFNIMFIYYYVINKILFSV